MSDATTTMAAQHFVPLRRTLRRHLPAGRHGTVPAPAVPPRYAGLATATDASTVAGPSLGGRAKAPPWGALGKA